MDTLICEAPDRSVDLSQVISAKVAQFGDGYSQRAFAGINPIRQAYSLSWTLETTLAKQIYNFLRPKEQVVAFLYTYPGDIERSYICSDLKYQDNQPAPSVVSATFTEVFDIR